MVAQQTTTVARVYTRPNIQGTALPEVTNYDQTVVTHNDLPDWTGTAIALLVIFVIIPLILVGIFLTWVALVLAVLFIVLLVVAFAVHAGGNNQPIARHVITNRRVLLYNGLGRVLAERHFSMDLMANAVGVRMDNSPTKNSHYPLRSGQVGQVVFTSPGNLPLVFDEVADPQGVVEIFNAVHESWARGEVFAGHR